MFRLRLTREERTHIYATYIDPNQSNMSPYAQKITPAYETVPVRTIHSTNEADNFNLPVQQKQTAESLNV